MKSMHEERGATIVEYVISAAVTGLLMIAAVALIASYSRKAAASNEVTDLEERRGALADLLKADFDMAGYNLTRPQAPAAGTELAIFSSATGYTSSAGTLTKTGSAGWRYAYTSRALGGGVGSVTFTPPASLAAAYVYASDNATFGFVIGSGGTMTIYETGTAVAATSGRPASETIARHSAGDVYRIGVELKTSGSAGTEVTLYRIRSGVPTLLWTRSQPLTAYPLGFMASAYATNSSFTSVYLTGAPIVSLTPDAGELTRMPVDRGARLSKPVVVASTGQSATILTADRSTDAAYLTGSFASTTAGGSIQFRQPARGSFQVGDIIDVIDYAADRACIYRVTQSSTLSGTTTLEVAPVTSTAPAWGRLSSTTVDSQYTFPVGASVVKLSPPVSYFVTTDRRLVRMEGNRVTTAAFNVRTLSFSETATTTGWTFTISLVLGAEGVDTSSTQLTETRATIEYTSTPRALNLQANQLN